MQFLSDVTLNYVIMQLALWPAMCFGDLPDSLCTHAFILAFQERH